MYRPAGRSSKTSTSASQALRMAARVSSTAADFGAQLVGVTNQYPHEHGDRALAFAAGGDSDTSLTVQRAVRLN
jgi:hypothetical protein